MFNLLTKALEKIQRLLPETERRSQSGISHKFTLQKKTPANFDLNLAYDEQQLTR